MNERNLRYLNCCWKDTTCAVFLFCVWMATRFAGARGLPASRLGVSGGDAGNVE